MSSFRRQWVGSEAQEVTAEVDLRVIALGRVWEKPHLGLVEYRGCCSLSLLLTRYQKIIDAQRLLTGCLLTLATLNTPPGE